MDSQGQGDYFEQGTKWLKTATDDKGVKPVFKDDWKELAREDVENFNTERQVNT